MGRIIGIDFGTTNSVVAICDGTQSRILNNREGKPQTPSLVSLRHRKSGADVSEDILIGDKAVDNRPMAPKDTIVSVKRLMGSAIGDPEVERVRTQVAYEILAPPDGTTESVRVVMGGKQYSPPEISALILGKLKADAEYKLGQEVTHAVITVPAYFNHRQKEATREACTRAGLEVDAIVPEPIAAAVAFGVGAEDSSRFKKVLVYHLGGATFDASVVTCLENGFSVVASRGDLWLGGDSFDQILIDHAVNEVQLKYNVDPRTNSRFMVELKNQVRGTKERLSLSSSADLRMVGGVLQDSEGNPIDLKLVVTRETYDQMIGPLVDRTIDLTKAALADAQIPPEEVDGALMSGGSAVTPAVVRAITDVFGADKLLRGSHPKHCVALGAAIFAVRAGDRHLAEPEPKLCVAEQGTREQGTADGQSLPREMAQEIRKAGEITKEAPSRPERAEADGPAAGAGENLINFTEFVIQEYGWALDPSYADRLTHLIAEARRQLEEQDERALREKTAALERALNQTPEAVQIFLGIRGAINMRVQPVDAAAAMTLAKDLDVVESAFKSRHPEAPTMLKALWERVSKTVDETERNLASLSAAPSEGSAVSESSASRLETTARTKKEREMALRQKAERERREVEMAQARRREEIENLLRQAREAATREDFGAAIVALRSATAGSSYTDYAGVIRANLAGYLNMRAVATFNGAMHKPATFGHEITAALRRAERDLMESLELDPSVTVVRENLETVRRAVSQLLPYDTDPLTVGQRRGSVASTKWWKKLWSRRKARLVPPSDSGTSLLRNPFRCSVFYPEKVGPKEVGRFIAYVHLEAVASEIVREAVRRLDLPTSVKVKASSEKPRIPLKRECIVDVTPEVPGLIFENLRASMRIWEDKQWVEFRFHPDQDLAGKACSGSVYFWLEGVILADVRVVVFVADEQVPDIFRERLNQANARPYRRVFPSYSHEDAEVVERLEAYAESFGDEYMRDVSKLRVGQRWADELGNFIRRADVFQLFWSERAAASAYVEQEWRHGLREREARPDPFFVRPVYWTKEPAPIPPELRDLHFVRVPLGD
ncbi:MAG: Hsp70 family protein [Terriglobia bacterium]|jgi:actin-like ATPase involved in cell morphogenesis/flagellum-specific peptidoglycan hydrolase FlgJ